MTVTSIVIGVGAGAAIAGRPTEPDPFRLTVAPTTSTRAGTPPDISASTTTTARPEVQWVAIGDSYTGGSLMGGDGAANWANVVQGYLDRDTYRIPWSVDAGGGSGYTQGGTRGLTFLDLVDEAVTGNDDIVVIFGSRNDDDPAAVDEASIKVFARVRELAPSAQLLVIGPAWVNENVPASILGIRDALERNASAVGAAFLDPIADRWFFGPDAALIGSDGVHPTDAGHEYMALRILPAIEALFPDPA